MSDWLRFADWKAIAALLALCLAWGSGGWLIVRALFALRRGERLLSGLALGLVLWITLANLLVQLISFSWAAAGAAGLVLMAGGLLAWRKRLPLAELAEDWHEWPQLLALLGLGWLFIIAQRGVGIFDDYLHLPLVSLMATGDIPPHFSYYAGLPYAYHYSLQVAAAALVRVVNFYPWTAWKLVKGLAIALTLQLAWLWVRRAGRAGLTTTLGALAIVFGGGARWLLLLFPLPVLEWMSRHIAMTLTGSDTAPTLLLALTKPWMVGGSGPVPFSFAFNFGFNAPVTQSLGATGALPFVIVLLALLLNPGQRLSWSGAGVFALLLACLALSAEHLFAFVWLGVALALLLMIVRLKGRPGSGWRPWLAVLFVSALLSLVQGGYITSMASSLLIRLTGQGSGTQYNLFAFTLAWPPGLETAHTGRLSLLDPAQFTLLLLEIGPALLLAPLAWIWALRSLRGGDWLAAGMGFAAPLLMIISLFASYGVERHLTRLANSAAWLWLAVGVPPLALLSRRRGPLWQAAVGTGFGVLVLGGVLTFAIQLTSIPAPQAADFITPLDIPFVQKYWNNLAPGSMLLDNQVERGVALFGRTTRAAEDIYTRLPDWQSLVRDPQPQAVLAAGYRYIYVDEEWWSRISGETRSALMSPCIQVLKEVTKGERLFRRLLDLEGCRR